MRKLSNITILTLSIGLASAPVLARQAVDPTDYVGYTHGAYKVSLASAPIDINLASAPAPAPAKQAADPTDYVGYTHGAYKISLASAPIDINPASAPVLARQAVDPTDYIGYTQGGGASAEPASSNHGVDDHESGRIGKLLWKSNHIQGGHSNVR